MSKLSSSRSLTYQHIALPPLSTLPDKMKALWLDLVILGWDYGIILCDDAFDRALKKRRLKREEVLSVFEGNFIENPRKTAWVNRRFLLDNPLFYAGKHNWMVSTLEHLEVLGFFPVFSQDVQLQSFIERFRTVHGTVQNKNKNALKEDKSTREGDKSMKLNLQGKDVKEQCNAICDPSQVIPLASIVTEGNYLNYLARFKEIWPEELTDKFARAIEKRGFSVPRQFFLGSDQSAQAAVIPFDSAPSA